MRNELPDVCLATLPGTGDLVILKRGETGYRFANLNSSDIARNEDIANSTNYNLGINPAQVGAMKVGAMYGFDAPGADPQRYFDGAALVGTRPLGNNSILDDPTEAFYKHVHGDLLEYKIAGERCYYLEMAAITELITGLQGRAVLLPDLVDGKPLIPVSVAFNQEKTGLVQMNFESGAFTTEAERNAGFQITAKVSVGPVEYAMGEMNSQFPSFVTWERAPANDGDGPPNYYCGHYFESQNEVIKDFCERANEMYEMLAEERKPSIKAQLAARAARAKTPVVQQRQKDKGER